MSQCSLCSPQEDIMCPHPVISERLQAHSLLEARAEQSLFLLSEQKKKKKKAGNSSMMAYSERNTLTEFKSLWFGEL